MENPFEYIDERLDKIEGLLMQLLEMERAFAHPPEKNILNVKEVSEYLGLSVSSIYGWVSQKKIPVNKRGGKCYFLREEIDKWISEGRVYTREEIHEQALAFIEQQQRKRAKRSR